MPPKKKSEAVAAIEHQCETSDGASITCLCPRGVDHAEALFDVSVGKEPPTEPAEAEPDVKNAPEQADDEHRHSDAGSGDPCEHPFCVAKADAEADATPEELETAARFGVPVLVLRGIRDQAAADIGAAVVARQDAGLDPQADYCGVCLPGGWPAGGNHMDCPHGTWTR